MCHPGLTVKVVIVVQFYNSAQLGANQFVNSLSLSFPRHSHDGDDDEINNKIWRYDKCVLSLLFLISHAYHFAGANTGERVANF